MEGRLRIELRAIDGSAAGEHIDLDVVLDLTAYGTTIDSSGQIFLSLSGRILDKRHDPPVKKR